MCTSLEKKKGKKKQKYECRNYVYECVYVCVCTYQHVCEQWLEFVEQPWERAIDARGNNV